MDTIGVGSSPSHAAGHRSFRGTRILVGAIVGFAGFVIVTFGGLAVPLAAGLGQSSVDPGLMATLVSLEPFFVAVGVLHVGAAIGVWADRGWGIALSLWMVAFGVFATVAGIVLAIAGRDPFALANPDPSAGTSGLGILFWTLGWYGVAAFGLGRVIAGRAR